MTSFRPRPPLAGLSEWLQELCLEDYEEAFCFFREGVEGFWVLGFGGFGFRVLGFRVWGFWGFGFRDFRGLGV